MKNCFKDWSQSSDILMFYVNKTRNEQSANVCWCNKMFYMVCASVRTINLVMLKLRLFTDAAIRMLLYCLYVCMDDNPLAKGERSGSVEECLTRDRGAAGSSLTGVTALWSLSKTHLS